MEHELASGKTARAIFLGDVYLGGPGSGTLPDGDMAALLEEHDLRCCNFEGAAWHENAVTHKKAGPAILQGPQAALRVLESGINLVTIANNHIMDYGKAGLDATLCALSGAAVIGAGDGEAMASIPYITEINGVKLGFLALTERQYGTLGGGMEAGSAHMLDAGVPGRIRRLRAECDHVVLLCHGGLEDVDQPLARWRCVYRGFIDAGASLVVGCHPHVPQGSEAYKHGTICYSLGNAAWEPETDFPCQRSIALSVTFARGECPACRILPMEYTGGKLRACEDPAFSAHLREMDRVLADPAAYAAAEAKICGDFYENVALPDFFTVTGALPGGLWQRVKNAAKLLLRRPALNRPLLLSMLENESYRWAVCEHLARERQRQGSD